MSKYTILENKSYAIRSQSTLEALVPIGKKGVTVSSIEGPFRKGTHGDTNAPILGDVEFDITSNSKGVKFLYKTKDRYSGDDSFEYILKYSDDTEAKQVIDLNIRPKKTPASYSERYIEVYLDGNETVSDFDFETVHFKEKKAVPTKITFSITDQGFNVEKKVSTHDNVVTEHIVEYPVTKTRFSSKAKVTNVMTDAGAIVKSIGNIKMSLTKQAPFNGTDYAMIKFKGFVSKATNSDVDIEEAIYIIFNARHIEEKVNSDTGIVIPPYPGFDKPNLTYPTLEYPEIPDNPSDEEEIETVAGDLFSNTRAHKENNNNTRTIKLGKKVPDGAVNLAYYYNTTASFDDTVSIVETNTNTVTLKHVEKWIHKINLDEQDESHFPDSIEFNGEVDTEFEGYWGVLYRDYIMWDEEIDIDQEPENAVVYEEFLGLNEQRVPMTKRYSKNGKSGVLNLVHSIFTATDFTKDPTGTSPSGYIPRKWSCQAKYEGLIRNNKVKYDGSAKFTGVVAKKDGMSNIDPEQPKEILMYPDNAGVLFNSKGENLIDDDLFYITDKFKDGKPLYFKHRMKFRVYDSVGPDRYGVYNSDSIKLVSENHMPIYGDEYKYKVHISPTEFDNIYDAYIYTSFIPTLEAPIYVMYDGVPEEAYSGKRSVNPLDIRVGILEKLSVIQAMDTDEYVVDVMQGLTQQSTITMKEFQIIDDKRDKVKIQYYVSAEGFETPPIPIEVINKKYALYSELDLFINDDMIASTKNNNGYMTAKDMLLAHLTDEQKKLIKDDTVFKVKFYTRDTVNTLYNKDKVLLFTDPDGKGLVYVRTYCDTGMPSDDSNNPRMNRILDTDSVYKSISGRIHKGYSVKCRNVNQIVISSPAESNPLKGWYPKIRYSYFNKVYERIDNTIQLIYSVPEFNTQVFGKYGKPYIDIKNEKPRYIGNNTVRVSHTPMYVKTNSLWEPVNIKATKMQADGTEKVLAIKSFNFLHGIIEFEDKLSENDPINVSYSYEEQYYHYKGYYENMDKTTKIIDLNLNPSMYSTYCDTRNEVHEQRQSYDLFNRTIHFFLRPMRIIDYNTGKVETDNLFTIYHKFDTQEAEGPFDLHIGRIFVRHHTSLKSTELMDTRVRGGGVIEAMSDTLRRELEPDSDFYLDIGSIDGKPYQENSVVLVRIDNRVLQVNGGRFTEDEVREIVCKWSAFGTFPIIEFVNIIQEEDMPHSTMVVNKHIANTMNYSPYFEAEVVEE